MVSDVLEQDGRELAADIGEAARFIPLDVTSEAAWENAMTETLAAFGRLDILVNNAGIFGGGGIEATALDDYLRTVMVNQTGVFLGMKAALPALKINGGAIVNISSGAGMQGTRTFAYGATKWAVRGMSRSAAREFAPYGIRVNCVLPNFIETDMIAGFMDGPRGQQVLAQTPLARAGRADEVAQLVLFLVSDASSYCTGGDFVIDGGRLA